MANAADRKSIRDAEKRAKLAERNRAEVLVGVMSTVPGREWLWNLLDVLNVFGSPIAEDPHRTYFLLGEQNAGKRLMADAMQFCPDLFIQAMREANQRRSEQVSLDEPEQEAVVEETEGPIPEVTENGEVIRL